MIIIVVVFIIYSERYSSSDLERTLHF